MRQCFSYCVTGMAMSAQMGKPLFFFLQQQDRGNLLDAIRKVSAEKGNLLVCEVPMGLFYLYTSLPTVTQTGTEGWKRRNYSKMQPFLSIANIRPVYFNLAIESSQLCREYRVKQTKLWMEHCLTNVDATWNQDSEIIIYRKIYVVLEHCFHHWKAPELL